MERVHIRTSFFIRASRSGREETLLHPSAQRKCGAQRYKLFTVGYSVRSRRLLEPPHAAGSRFSRLFEKTIGGVLRVFTSVSRIVVLPSMFHFKQAWLRLYWEC